MSNQLLDAAKAGSTEEAIKIGYEQLRDCQTIISSRDELTSGKGKELLKEIKRLVGESRSNRYCDYSYELLQALEDNNSVEAKLIRDRYFPTHGNI